MIRVTNASKVVLTLKGTPLKPGASRAFTEESWEFYETAHNVMAQVKAGALVVESFEAPGTEKPKAAPARDVKSNKSAD